MILIDLFESRMSELDIEYQDWKNLEPVAFYSRYKMSKDQWAGKHWSLIKGGQTVHEQDVTEDDLDEIDRRGFLKGLGATAGLAAMGGAKAADEREAAVWDPSWNKPGQPFDTSITSNSTVTQTGNQRPKLGDRIGSVKGPNAKGEYLVTVINNGEIVSNYVTKTPPASWMHGKHKSYPQVSETQDVAEGAMKDLHTELAEKYRELAPSIEKYKDSFLAGQLYDALEAIAIEHGAELELKRMMTGARNRAHMDYDTNPGGFQNWFWYLPFADEQLDEKQDACYHKVKSRYKVWPSAYASGALVQCRKKGAANWGNKSKE